MGTLKDKLYDELNAAEKALRRLDRRLFELSLIGFAGAAVFAVVLFDSYLWLAILSPLVLYMICAHRLLRRAMTETIAPPNKDDDELLRTHK